MISRAGPAQPSARTGLSRLLRNNLLVSALVFALLEIWRPLYFLTDDNLGGGFPLLTGIGRRLAHGRSPFITDDIFGGHYDLLRDCSSFVWHPVYLLFSLLAETPAHFLIIDAIAFCFLMLATAGFVNLAAFLREDLDLPLSDARLMLYTLSFTYSMIVLCTGSSWLNFLADHSALPWLALGILQRSWRRGLGLVTLFSLHHLLGGHLGATLGDSLFLTLFALGISLHRRSLLPLGSWFLGYSAAVLIILPILLPAAAGFLDAERSGGLNIVSMSKFAIPAALFPCSIFLATFSAFIPFHYGFGTTSVLYASGFVSCLAAWALIPALISRARWHFFEIFSLALAGVAALLVIRPLWVTEAMLHLPLLRSMRWPFREILQFQFFLHLFLVVRPLGGTLRFQRLTTFIGAFLFLFPFSFIPAPTFHELALDRQLLFSGNLDRYWAQVRTFLAPGDCLATIGDRMLIVTHPDDVPFSLLNTYDFPILTGVKSVTGYTVTAPRDQLYVAVEPTMSLGIYAPDQKAEILRQRPHVRFITLESLHPLRITLSSPAGPIDLTPFAAEALHRPRKR